MFSYNTKLKSVFLIGFLFSFHLALTAYVNSTFLSGFFGEKKAGLIYTVASLSAIIALLLIPNAIRYALQHTSVQISLIRELLDRLIVRLRIYQLISIG